MKIQYDLVFSVYQYTLWLWLWLMNWYVVLSIKQIILDNRKLEWKNVSNIRRLKFCSCLELTGPWVFTNYQREVWIKNLAGIPYNIRIACHAIHRTFKNGAFIDKLCNRVRNVKEDTFQAAAAFMMLFKDKHIVKVCIPKITIK